MKKGGIPGGKGGMIYPPRKGEVRNPNGRPLGVPNTKTRLKQAMALMLERKNLDGVIEKKTIAEWGDLAQIKEMLEGNTRAYAEILDRMEGKVTIDVKSDVNNTGVPSVVQLIRVDKRPTDVATSEQEIISREGL